MIPPEHKPLLHKIKKVFISWNTEKITPQEKNLQAYHEVRELYEGYGFAAMRYAYKNALGKQSFFRHVKREGVRGARNRVWEER